MLTQDSNRPTLPLERGWLDLDAAGRSYLVARTVFLPGPNGKAWKDGAGPKKNITLTQSELVDLLNGRHGPQLQGAFALAVVGGVRRTLQWSQPALRYESFGEACLKENQLDFLFDVARAESPFADSNLSEVAWCDALSWVIRKGDDGKTVVNVCSSLLRTALNPALKLSPEVTAAAAERFLELCPDHYDIAQLMDEGGPGAAYLARALMLREVNAAAAAAPAAPIPEQTPPTPRRRRAGI